MTTPVIYKFILLFMSVFVVRPNISVEVKENCAQKLDLVIIVDTSSSVTGPNFKLSIAFIQNLLRPLQIGPDNIRVALMRYSTDVEVVSYLGERMNKEEKEKDLLKIKYKYGNTHTHEALRKTTTDVLVEKKGDRPEVQDLVVLITDGKSTKRGTKEEAMKLKSKQFLKILTIGVTKEIDEPELRNVSSGADLFLKIDSFADFNRHLDQLKVVVCSGGDVSLNAQPSVQGVKGNNDSSLQNFETSTTFKTRLTSFNHHNKMMTFMPSTIKHQPESVSSHVDSGSIFSTSLVFFVPSVPSLPLITLDSSVMPSLSILPTVISPLTPVSETSLLPSFMNTDLFSSTVMQDIVSTSSLAFSESDFRTSQSIKDTVVLPWISDHDTLSPTFSSPIYLSSFLLNTEIFPPPSSSEIMPSLVSSGSEIRSSVTETGVLDISSSNLDTIILPSSSILEIGRIFPSPSISDSVISPSPSISDTVISPSPSTLDTVTFSSPSISDTVLFPLPFIFPSITSSMSIDTLVSPSSMSIDTLVSPSSMSIDTLVSPSSMSIDTLVSPSSMSIDTLVSPSSMSIDTLVSPSSMSIDTLMSPSSMSIDTLVSPSSMSIDTLVSPSSMSIDALVSPSSMSIDALVSPSSMSIDALVSPTSMSIDALVSPTSMSIDALVSPSSMSIDALVSPTSMSIDALVSPSSMSIDALVSPTSMSIDALVSPSSMSIDALVSPSSMSINTLVSPSSMSIDTLVSPSSMSIDALVSPSSMSIDALVSPSSMSIETLVSPSSMSIDTLVSPSSMSIHTLVSSSSMSIDTLVSPSSVSKTTSLKVYPRDSQEYLPLINNEQSSIFFLLENSKTVSKTVSLTSTVQVMSALLSMINYLDQNRELNNKMPSFVPTNSIMTSSEVSFSLPKELFSLSSVRTASLKNNKLLESFTSYTNQFSERAQPTSSSVWHQSVMIENYNASIFTGTETRRTLWTSLSATIAGFIAVLLAGIVLAVVSRKTQERAREEAAQINVEAQ